MESVVLENEREELTDQVEADDSECVAELKRKLKKVTDENRKLRSKLSVLNTRLNSFLRKDQFSALTRKILKVCYGRRKR